MKMMFIGNKILACTACILIASTVVSGFTYFQEERTSNVQQGCSMSGTTADYEDSPFGFHPANIYKIGYPDNGFVDAQNIGVRWHRPSVYAFWFLIQPSLNDAIYDWTMYDEQYGLVPQGMNILANIAPENPGSPQGYTLQGSYIPVDEEKYSEFVRLTVERYDGDGTDDMPGLTNPIKYWQVGNEPHADLSGFADLQRITYLAIKEADSNATVLIGGVAGFPNNYVRQFDSVYSSILANLAGQYVDVFDFHWYGTAMGEYRLKDTITGEDIYEHVRATLTANGFSLDLPIWITEMGSYSGNPSGHQFCFQTEKQQAYDYLKRCVYPLSLGVKKIFPAFGLMEGFKHNDGYFDHTGLIYDGDGSNDRGLGVKKLSYYTYKLMVEKLECSDWDYIETIIDGTDNVHAYNFTKKDTDKPIWVVWWDYFDDAGSSETITLDVGDIESVKITEAVPDAESGVDLNENDYPGFFKTETKQVTDGKVTITLGKNPVFVEEMMSLVYVTINKPKEGKIYLMNKEVSSINSDSAIVIGKITVEADAYDEDGIDRVEFYINDVLKNTDDESPYEWLWNETIFGRHYLKVAAYDNEGNEVKDSINIIIFNIGR
jgi:hypothetical protein